ILDARRPLCLNAIEAARYQRGWTPSALRRDTARSLGSFIFAEVFMIARTMRVLPGVVASVMLLAVPAYADNVLDSKHRATSFHRRSSPNPRNARLDRHHYARHAR